MSFPLLRSFGLILLASAGCSASDVDAGRQAIVRDSAGVRIVENRDPVWTSEMRWTVDSLPSVTIGVEEGDPQREFFRLTDARRLSDGRIVAANSSSNELRYFTGQGKYLCTSGRQGAGPGEFERLAWLQLLPHDTLLVYSSGGGGRLSVFSPEGHFVRTVTVPRAGDGRYSSPMGMLPNGALLVSFGRGYGMGVPSGTYRDSVSLVVHRGDSTIASIGPLPSMESVVVATANSMSVTSLVFGRYLVTGFAPDGFLVGTNEQYELFRYDTLGRLTGSIRLDRAPTPVTASAIAEAESTRLASASNANERARSEAFFKQMQFPPTMPAYGRVLVDSEGNIWVSRYSVTRVSGDWDVFDADGQLLGELQLPPRFTPRQITGSRLIGTARDELEVERVQVHALRKGTPAREGRAAPVAGTAGDDDIVPSEYRACAVKAMRDASPQP
jgi:hypothetical protein